MPSAYALLTPEQRAALPTGAAYAARARASHQPVVDAYARHRRRPPLLRNTGDLGPVPPPAARVDDLGAGYAVFVDLPSVDDGSYAYAADPEQTDNVGGQVCWSVGFYVEPSGATLNVDLPADADPERVARALFAVVLLALAGAVQAR